jgi:threonine synthase
MSDDTSRPSVGDAPDAGLFLLDGARAGPWTLPPELEARRIVATDTERPVEQRLEAFEDVIDAEIGDTDLNRARNLERDTGIRQLYVKFEGANPSGTQKDRIAFAQALDALRRGYGGVTVATCGNYGVAMSQAARMAGIDCHVFIPVGYKTRRTEEMRALGAVIERVEGDYERAVEHSRQVAIDRELYDANPGGANTDLQIRAYGHIAYEIYDELRDAPAAIAVPVSNGTTLAGIHRGFVRLHLRGKTSRIPKLVAGSSYRKNPVVQSFLAGKTTCEDLAPGSIRETHVNEPLINWHAIDGQHALDAIRATGGWADHATDKELTTLTRQLRDHQGLRVLPASTAGLHALLSRHRTQPLGPDRYVAILTGRLA